MKFKYFSVLLLAFSNAYASNEGLQGEIKVKDLEDLGLNVKSVVGKFSNQIELNAEEYVYFKSHHETQVVDITTFDGYIRSFDGSEVAQPKNLITEAKLSPQLKKSAKF